MTTDAVQDQIAPASPTRRRGRAGVVLAVFAVWTLIVTGLALYVGRSGDTTAPEQTSLEQTMEDADRVFGDLLAALDPARTVVTIGGYRQISDHCRITPARHGARLERVMTVYLNQGGESRLLGLVARDLPARYDPRLTVGRGKPVLTAMDRTYIGIRGVGDGAGQIRISLDTGCRPGAVPSLAPVSADLAPAAARTAVAAGFEGLHLAPGPLTAFSVPCRAGGRLWTVEATAAGGAAPISGVAPLGQEATVVLNLSGSVAYQAGGQGAVIRRVGEDVTVAATADCRR